MQTLNFFPHFRQSFFCTFRSMRFSSVRSVLSLFAPQYGHTTRIRKTYFKRSSSSPDSDTRGGSYPGILLVCTSESPLITAFGHCGQRREGPAKGGGVVVMVAPGE